MAIVITPGEPAGIGPDITIMVAQRKWPLALVAIADPALLNARAKEINLSLKIIEVTQDKLASLKPLESTSLYILPVKLKQPVVPGKLNPDNSAYVLHTLEIANELALKKIAQAIVTGPVHKGVMNDGGIDFIGHTELFAQLSHVKKTVMLFVVDKTKIALATTHIPLAKVPSAITKEALRSTILVLVAGLQKQFGVANPRILISGINPHAGENGHLGNEEIDTIKPLLKEMQQQGFNLHGPLPADSIFTANHLAEADAILAMYHDQALPVVKFMGFHKAVNVTLGLPFIRTSVDHGTALELAGSGQANAGSMHAAVNLAISMS